MKYSKPKIIAQNSSSAIFAMSCLDSDKSVRCSNSCMISM
jgi:hypothetical protein